MWCWRKEKCQGRVTKGSFEIFPSWRCIICLFQPTALLWSDAVQMMGGTFLGNNCCRVDWGFGTRLLLFAATRLRAWHLTQSGGGVLCHPEDRCPASPSFNLSPPKAASTHKLSRYMNSNVDIIATLRWMYIRDAEIQLFQSQTRPNQPDFTWLFTCQSMPRCLP